MDGKSILTSKTIIVNVLIIALSVLGMAEFQTLATVVVPYLPIIIPMINVVLRLLTSQPITSIK